MANPLTVPGAVGHVVPVTISGSHAYALAHSYAAAVNASASIVVSTDQGSASVFGGADAYYTVDVVSQAGIGQHDTITAGAGISGGVGVSAPASGIAPVFIGGAGIVSNAGTATVFGASGFDAKTASLFAGAGNETLNGSGSTPDFAGFAASPAAASALHAATTLAGSGVTAATISDFGSASSTLISLFGHGANEVLKSATDIVTSGGRTTVTLGDSSKVTFLSVNTIHPSSFHS